MPPRTDGFYEQAWSLIRNIPAGRVMTYRDVARALGRPGAARAVGTAMRLNPNPGSHTPCHRVVRSDGSVGHYMGGPDGTRRKTDMLRREGVQVGPDGRVHGLDRFRWIPRTTT